MEMEGVGLSGTLGRFEILRLLLQDLNHFSKEKCIYFWGVLGHLGLYWGPIGSQI